MVKRAGWFLVCALVIGLAGRAQAQTPEGGELGSNWDLRAGFMIPESEAMRNASSDIWLTIGAERAIYEGERYRGTLSIDYYGKDNKYNIPIQLNVRTETNRLHYGVGAGVSFGNGLTRSTTAFAYNLMVGYSVIQGPKPVVAEIRYRGVAHGKGEMNGWAITVGTRF